MNIESIIVGSVVEMRNAYQSFFYVVLEVPADKKVGRFTVNTENGKCYYLAEDFYSIADRFDFDKVAITKDNIHLYYEFMRYEDLKTNHKILNTLFNFRYNKVEKELNKAIKRSDVHMRVDSTIIYPNGNSFDDNNYKAYTGLDCFGIKDTLKPIDDYIADIKESEEYKKYIYESVIKKYNLLPAVVEHRSSEIFDSISFENLTYSAMDIVSSNFKRAMLFHTDMREPDEPLPIIKSISDIYIPFTGHSFDVDFDFRDTSESNVLLFFDNYPHSKSEDARLVLKMMDNGISYADALEKVLKISSVPRGELKKELEFILHPNEHKEK